MGPFVVQTYTAPGVSQVTLIGHFDYHCIYFIGIYGGCVDCYRSSVSDLLLLTSFISKSMSQRDYISADH